jgi:hypothetical protein
MMDIMEELRILCKCCNTEIVKTGTCGCPNMASIRNDRISAVDMTQIVLLTPIKSKTYNSIFSPTDLADQESRRKRKVRKLEFEVR